MFPTILSLPVTHSRYLQTFIAATLFVSQDSVPLVYLVIPLVDNIYEVLADAQANVDKHMLVRHASGCALVVLDKYKALINESDIYKVAMSTYYLFFT